MESDAQFIFSTITPDKLICCESFIITSDAYSFVQDIRTAQSKQLNNKYLFII
jgi:hypothetical protein